MGPMSARDNDTPGHPESIDTLEWQADELGPAFERIDLPLGPDPDGEGEVHATLVRRVPDTPTGKPVVLWVHGMTDYFFHTHVADYFAQEGYPFYALDLRKCGRAHATGQRWHYVSDLAHYFPDLTKAAEYITGKHSQVVPLAHSTGGLIVPVWADYLRQHNPAVHSRVAGLILNSPWLDMQYPRLLVRVATPIVKFVGKRWPLVPIPGGNLDTYGASIYAGRYGEWEFDLDKKPVGGHKKYLGWLRTIVAYQALIHRGQVDAGVPVLSLCSTRSHLNQQYSPAADVADVVLDVDDIQRWSASLSTDVRVRAIDNARHDVFLSRSEPLRQAFEVTRLWLESLQADEHPSH